MYNNYFTGCTVKEPEMLLNWQYVGDPKTFAKKLTIFAWKLSSVSVVFFFFFCQ